MEEREIVALSFPFVAGVWLASESGHALLLTSVAFPLSLALLAFSALSRRCSRLLLPLLFFSLGLSRWSMETCSNPAHPGPGPAIPLLSEALERLCAAIGGIPFRDSRTAPLLQALLVGRRNFLDRETVAMFRKSGAAHILALSGLHLGVISSVAGKVLSVLGNSPVAMAFRSVAVILFSGMYVVMTGASPSLVRAFIFIFFNELAKLLPGRRHSPLGIFCAAATIQLCLAPGVVSSVSFQLSYLSMLGIVTLFPVLDKWYPDTGFRRLDRVNVPRRIWTSVALSFSCQLFTFPVAWSHFHTFPQYFMITNMLALPLSELLITLALPLVVLELSGASTDAYVHVVDCLVKLLLDCLEVISSM